MRQRPRTAGPFKLFAVLGLMLLALAALGAGLLHAARGQAAPRVDVLGSGLRNPRGLAFDAAGVLHVAEAGTSGRQRVQVDTGRRYNIGFSGRVSRILTPGTREDVLADLPSTFTSHDDDVGPASLAWLDGRFFLLTNGGGTEVGDSRFDNVVAEITPTGPRSLINLNEYNAAYPSQARLNDPVKADVPGGMPWGITAFGGRLYVTDANHEFVLEVGLDGSARRVVEYPRSYRVLTGISDGGDGWMYIAELGPYPYLEGSGGVIRARPDGTIETVLDSLTTSIAVVRSADGALFVLEFSAPLRQVPQSGRVIRVEPSGARTILVEGLHFPTAMIQGPDGALYVSNSGHLANRGEGQVLRIEPGRSHPVLELFGMK